MLNWDQTRQVQFVDESTKWQARLLGMPSSLAMIQNVVGELAIQGSQTYAGPDATQCFELQASIGIHMIAVSNLFYLG